MSEPIDILELRLLRLGKERSKAVESKYYRNPADNVKFESERSKAVKPRRGRK